MRKLLIAMVAAVAGMIGPVQLASGASIINIQNFQLHATPPGDFVPNVNGRALPSGFVRWVMTFDTTGLPEDQLLANVMVQLHYTNAQLGQTGLPNQGQVTNTDGTVTQITGGLFTGWIDSCSSPLPTSFVDKQGNVVHAAALGCTLNRILGYYPNAVRFLVIETPGYGPIPVDVSFE